MHQSLQGATFHLEHVHPSALDGPSTFDNLALSCPSCNLYKSNLLQAPDPDTGQPAPLFNPRTDKWSHHFTWYEFTMVPLTQVGRATTALLRFNHPRKLLIRQAEQRFGLFPPPS
jgi:hypothetical protein